MGRKRLGPDERSENVTVRLKPPTMRKVAQLQGLSPVPVSAAAVLRWLVDKGIESVEKEAANG